jgi:hypothetical protein
MAQGKKKIFDREWEDWNAGEKAGVIVLGIIAGVGLLFLFGFIVMSLWNWLMPKIFGLPVLGYWEAWGVLILSCILFGRLGGGHRSAERGRKRKLRARLREMAEECDSEEKKDDSPQARA